jgi:hypothetical protein
LEAGGAEGAVAVGAGVVEGVVAVGVGAPLGLASSGFTGSAAGAVAVLGAASRFAVAGRCRIFDRRVGGGAMCSSDGTP